VKYWSVCRGNGYDNVVFDVDGIDLLNKYETCYCQYNTYTDTAVRHAALPKTASMNYLKQIYTGFLKAHCKLLYSKC